MKNLLVALALTLSSYGVPVVSNGGFETGDFSGWQVSGGGASVASNVVGDGFSGLFHGLLNLTGPAGTTLAADLDTFLGLPSGCLEDDDILYGVAIRQVISLRDDQELSLLYNFLTGITASGFDAGTFAYFTIGDGAGNGINIPLGDPYSPSEPLLGTSPREGYARTYNIASDTESLGPILYSENGLYTIGLVLASTGATTPNVALAFDDVLAVPEPSDAPEVTGLQGLPLLLILVLSAERRRRDAPLLR